MSHRPIAKKQAARAEREERKRLFLDHHGHKIKRRHARATPKLRQTQTREAARRLRQMEARG